MFAWNIFLALLFANFLTTISHANVVVYKAHQSRYVVGVVKGKKGYETIEFKILDKKSPKFSRFIAGPFDLAALIQHKNTLGSQLAHSHPAPGSKLFKILNWRYEVLDLAIPNPNQYGEGIIKELTFTNEEQDGYGRSIRAFTRELRATLHQFKSVSAQPVKGVRSKPSVQSEQNQLKELNSGPNAI